MKFLILLLSTFILCKLHAKDNNSLLQVNSSFREIYTKRKAQELSALDPIIISRGGTLTLLSKDRREKVLYIPDNYHRLKEISHIPLMINLLIESNNRAELLRMIPTLEKIKSSLDKLNLHKEIIERQKRIVFLCEEFIANFPEQEPLQFSREVSPLLLENVEDAAFFQLDALHSQVQEWKKHFPPEQWNRLAVIVMGPQLPRIGEVSMQYFARLTGTPLERTREDRSWSHLWNDRKDVIKPSKRNRRLVYAENAATEAEALDLLATHIVDEAIGRHFFDDKYRMKFDLLAEAAAKRLAEKCDCENKEKKK